ncbi:hypothetical protein BBI08_10990 [Planococcus halocryophilus]|uniref:Uncharacterized protein n=1 Tax=Planococcus halocryophilus TaxID=1215089 RepID=A0A1C7DRU3_9BACL|nr:hypothetical protein BBI08_10990 [Planococcus halocryophilus]
MWILVLFAREKRGIRVFGFGVGRVRGLEGGICAVSGGLRTVLEKYARSGRVYARRKKLPRGGETLVRVPQKIRAYGLRNAKKPPTQVRG